MIRNTITAIAVLLFTACGEAFFDTQYKNGIDKKTEDGLLKNSPEALLNTSVRSIYTSMVALGATHDNFGYMTIMHVADMTAQDMVQARSHWFNYDYNFDNRMANYKRTGALWTTLYTMIANANTIIGLYREEPHEPVHKAGLGQAYAIRGLAYSYLIQLYQHSGTGNPAIAERPGVPLRFAATENIDEKERTQLTGRNTVARVHQQIEADLMRAVRLLDAYRRPFKYLVDQQVAQGFLARFYLLTGRWEKAEAAAHEAGRNYKIMTKAQLHDGFMDILNDEWMWGFDHTTETQTLYGSFFSHLSNLAPGYAGAGYAPRLIDAALYAAIPPTDERKTLFNDSTGRPGPNGNYIHASDWPYANLKFGDKGDWTMDYVYMRAAEMVLIEAEAQLRQGKATEAAVTLKRLMANRDPAWNRTTVSIDDIFLQRRIELWGEGFGFFDLKRLNKGIDRTYRGSNHPVKIKAPAGDARWLYQIPLAEIQENPFIKEEDQNP
jgi:hypothetical protein